MNQSLRERLDETIALREEGRAKQDMVILNEARTQLIKMSEEDPQNAEINYQIGIAHDNSGFTKEAITYYVKAIDQGLSGSDLERCLLGLGSSYRLLGQYDKAVETLHKGVTHFPDHRGLQIFYSIALYNKGRYKEAMEIALMNLMETTNDEKLQYFKKGITFYAQHLDETWDD
ncbi:tetratricopeptide repeat protein [Fictibacillus phosphorivorans]|uniref:tetratricopeptide repeat protein n=1 Tax=Fictibacillus phosphorivorans TaxID=1221500 RepID=UPI00203ADB2F|nr:tetratricopeptide repeat protein [Fictibacillus phosphorivorans]MCM3718059.1 tetratricopeptide repeat protein [Fictibacillus phosphorivorans]MCM3775686.1 tetratricopeptide repeat protein [Fictibacillus phosphorivorans]